MQFVYLPFLMCYNLPMKFVELKKHILAGNLYCCYNIYGDDSFLIDSSLGFFVKFVANNMELSQTVLSAENFDEKVLLSNLNTSSFLGGRKVVILKDTNEGKEKPICDAIVNYEKNPNSENILVIISKNPLFDEKKLQNLNKSSNFLCNVDCGRLDENNILIWIELNLKEKNISMTDSAKKLLMDYTNCYLSRISIEIDKLASYAKDRQIVDEDVKLLVNKELEYSVFELTENLSLGKAEESYIILNEMLADKKIAPSVFLLIQNHFRRMFFSAITPKTNLQIADDLGVKEFAVKKAKIQSKNFSKVVLKDIVELCADLDFKIKTSQISYLNAVNYLVSYILSNNKMRQ
ncbi:MAG TPA: DNA polymerase III subunit delta [Clostridiales bacterium]|nr:DNA polymerase III subunit delta [Clostridiales bacterium]